MNRSKLIVEPVAWNSPAFVYAEWLELLALSRFPHGSGQADIRSYLEGAADDFTEHKNANELEDKIETIVQSVFDEFSLRQMWAGKGYPFSVASGRVTLKNPLDHSVLNNSHLAYLFSLLATYYRYDFNRRFKSTSRKRRVTAGKAGVRKKKEITFPESDKIEDIFQVCGTIASAGLIGGAHVISFGFPRVACPPFYEALQSFGSRFQEGEPSSGRLPGAPPSPKDGAVDIVGWRPCPDGEPGQIYLLGQCASGDNWRTEKGPVTAFKEFHKHYWTRAPNSPILAATFLPFDFRLSADKVGYPNEREAWKWTRWRLTGTHGVLVDRFRLANYFARGLKIARWSGYKIDGLEFLPNLSAWVLKAITFLKSNQ